MAPAPEVDPGPRRRFNLARSIKDAIDEVARIEQGLRRYLAKIERLYLELCMLERVVLEAAGKEEPRRARRQPYLPGAIPAAFRCVLDGAPGAPTLTIDSAKPVSLSVTLAALVKVLAGADGPSCDELVGWKSLEQIAGSLEKSLGRPFNRHSVSQLLWRLRGKVSAAGLDCRLVESAPDLGARLRVKRVPQALAAVRALIEEE